MVIFTSAQGDRHSKTSPKRFSDEHTSYHLHVCVRFNLTRTMLFISLAGKVITRSYDDNSSEMKSSQKQCLDMLLLSLLE